MRYQSASRVKKWKCFAHLARVFLTGVYVCLRRECGTEVVRDEKHSQVHALELRSFMKVVILAIALNVLACAQSPLPGDSQQNVPGSLVSISVRGSAAVQNVGSSVSLAVSGTFSNGSTRDVTRNVTWTAETPTVAAVGTRTSKPEATCLAPGRTALIATSGSVSASARLTCQAIRSPGCGAGPSGTDIYDQSTCGNYSGAPYEDLMTSSSSSPPSPFGSGRLHQVGGGCPGVIVPTPGDVWRFTGDINDGDGGTNQNCIHFAGKNGNDFVLDLAGFSLTGGIKCDQTMGGSDCSGISIVNGTVNCNIATGEPVACISLNQPGNPSKSILFSHLTVNNLNSRLNQDGAYSGFEFAIFIQVSGLASTSCPAGADQKIFNKACIEIAHLTVSNGFRYDGRGYGKQWCMRCTSIFIGGNGGVTAEVQRRFGTAASPTTHLWTRTRVSCFFTLDEVLRTTTIFPG